MNNLRKLFEKFSNLVPTSGRARYSVASKGPVLGFCKRSNSRLLGLVMLCHIVTSTENIVKRNAAQIVIKLFRIFSFTLFFQLTTNPCFATDGNK